MQGGWQPPPGGGGGGYGAPPGGGGYGAPPGGGYGQPPGGGGPPGYGGPPPQGFAPNPYGAPGAPQGLMQPQYGNYEFNDYENSVIDKVASRAKLWGIISTVVGSFYLLSSCGFFFKGDLLMNFPGGVVAIVVGIVFMGAGSSLKAVVTTQGNDMQHLMTAFQKMSTAFIIQIGCAIAGVALGFIVFMLLAFVIAASAAGGQ